MYIIISLCVAIQLINAIVYLYAVCKKLLQICSTAPSVTTAMHWAPVQTVIPITVFSTAVCLDRARTLADWQHFWNLFVPATSHT